jgi:ribosomal protein S18 acetylase RimI-like enzyme
LVQAKQRGVPLGLSVLKVNPASKLYVRLGFTIIGEDEFRLYMEAIPKAD